ncbi:uncharacterized protein BX664DRAFT_343010 [Halteromyces radiatus]|uniref:uncharacterized protein n=1 Tax=Halteromyces radiatus TaxID=101107 RepID=UPI0022203819|nr:uncharacterized protein BX664DRAFT_343010 [Halteromyces radiatus]KAI8078897.1 hypothetical protein BX664DRAFT_343010 [Halteromyces radiatus]
MMEGDDIYGFSSTVTKLSPELQEFRLRIPTITEDERSIRVLQPHIREHVLAYEPTALQEIQRLVLVKDGVRATINSRLSLPQTRTVIHQIRKCGTEDYQQRQQQQTDAGKETMNILIAPSVRIDVEQRPRLDPSSSNGFEPSPSSLIFIPKRFITWYNSMTFDNGYKQLYSFDELAQLRKVRSKFSAASTYLLCRSSSVFTNDIRSRPATIWTLCDFDANQGNISSASMVSRLFRAVATSVFDNGKEATLESKLVQEIANKLKNGLWWISREKAFMMYSYF